MFDCLSGRLGCLSSKVVYRGRDKYTRGVEHSRASESGIMKCYPYLEERFLLRDYLEVGFVDAYCSLLKTLQDILSHAFEISSFFFKQIKLSSSTKFTRYKKH